MKSATSTQPSSRSMMLSDLRSHQWLHLGSIQASHESVNSLANKVTPLVFCHSSVRESTPGMFEANMGASRVSGLGIRKKRSNSGQFVGPGCDSPIRHGRTDEGGDNEPPQRDNTWCSAVFFGMASQFLRRWWFGASLLTSPSFCTITSERVYVDRVCIASHPEDIRQIRSARAKRIRPGRALPGKRGDRASEAD